jgi:hypothetical protein
MKPFLIAFLISYLFVRLTTRIFNFLSGRSFFLDRMDARRINKLSIQAADQQWQQTPKKNLIVSLTTLPSRIALLDNTLKSLMIQNPAPQAIELNIPSYSDREQCAYIIPEHWNTLSSLRICESEDTGPSTKCIPTLERHTPDQAILIVDDDYLYPQGMIRRMDRLQAQHPDQIIANSGWIVPKDCIDRPTTLWSNITLAPPTPILSPRLRTSRQVDIIQGFSGYLIRPRFFDLESLKDYSNAPKALRFVDDVWISAHSKVPKYVYPAYRSCFEEWYKVKHYKATSLGLLNRGEGTPESRNNTVGIQHFRSKWLLNQS